MSKFYYGNPENTGSWKQAASIFAAHDSATSAKTSSLPLVQFWKDDNGFKFRVKNLCEACNNTKLILNDKNNLFCFEYPVSLPENCGKGKASMTDLMIITENHAIAVEAKFMECKDNHYKPLVEKWLNDAPKGYTNEYQKKIHENREKVINGWLKYINDYLEHIKDYNKLREDKVLSIPYQLVHRIASACKVANDYKVANDRNMTPMVVYQLFYDETTKDNMEKFSQNLLAHISELALNNIPIYVVKTEVSEIKKDIGPELINGKKRFNHLFLQMMEGSDAVFKFGHTDLCKRDESCAP